MTIDMHISSWMHSAWKVFWSLKYAIVITIIGSTAASYVAQDYLGHRRERAVAMENELQALRRVEAQILEILTETDPLWTRGEPIPDSTINKLANAATDAYAAVSRINRPSGRISSLYERYLSAIASLRNAAIKYKHEERHVRQLYTAINDYGKSKDRFGMAIERQIENYNRSLFANL
jgi:hypothetical protein